MKKIAQAIAAAALITAAATPAMAADSPAVTQAVNTKTFYQLLLDYFQATLSYEGSVYNALATVPGIDKSALQKVSDNLATVTTVQGRLIGYLQSVITIK